MYLGVVLGRGWGTVGGGGGVGCAGVRICVGGILCRYEEDELLLNVNGRN